MSFLNLWWAVGVAAVVVPLLLILYFLKLRRREEPVASTLLWKRAVQDLQVNAPFQRLRKNLLLLLQLLILALAILALARPIIDTTVADEDRLVLLIDHSASMNTVEPDGETRLEQAQQQAIGLVRSLNRRAGGWRSILSFGGAEATTRAMVIAFAQRATVVSPFTTNTSDLVELIEGIKPSDGQTNLREALELAEAYMAPPTMTTDKTPLSAETPSKLVLVSDGRIADLGKLVLKSGTLEMIRIGQETDNVGITALRTRRNYERPELLSVFLTARNFGPQPVACDVSIYVDGILAAVKPLTLAARQRRAAPSSTDTTDPNAAGSVTAGAAEDLLNEGSSAALSFDLPLTTAAVVEARLSRDDALAADNRAYAVVPPPRKLRVLTVTANNYFLDSALRPLPLAERSFVTPEQWEADAQGEFEVDRHSAFDVVIFDKYQPTRLPPGNYLFIAAVPRLETVQAGEQIEGHALIWWDETHPVLRHVALEAVVVFEGLTLEVPDEAEVLIEGPRGPVLARYAVDGRHCLMLTFAVERSNWWSKPSFPVFMYNMIRYLGGGGVEVKEGPARPGATLRIPIPPEAERVTLRRPDNSSVQLTPETPGVAYYADTDRVGLYEVQGGVPGRERFAINLEDDWESDITPPAGPLTIDSRAVTELQAMKTATPEVWRWFVGAALVLVLLEWWIYNRRVMI